MTASIGMAIFDGLSALEMLAAADSAMYEAKEGGGDRFALYRASYGPSLPSRLVFAKATRRTPCSTSPSDSV